MPRICPSHHLATEETEVSLLRPEQQIDGRGGGEVDGGCCEFSARSAQPESVVFFLPASRISSITPAVSSQSPSYMCAAAGLLLAGENHRLVQKGGGAGGVQGAPPTVRGQRHACADSAICFFGVCFVERRKPGHRPHHTKGGGPRCGTNNALISTPGRDSGRRS